MPLYKIDFQTNRIPRIAVCNAKDALEALDIIYEQNYYHLVINNIVVLGNDAIFLEKKDKN